MRLLQSIRSVNPEGGGVIEAVKQFSLALEREGHEISIASLDDPADPWIAACPHRVVALGPGTGGYGFAPRFIPWLSDRAGEFDAVIVNGLWQFSSLGVWRALRGSGCPFFVFPHGMLDPWFKRTYPLKHLKKWLYWPWAEYRVLRDAEAVLFTCKQEKELARKSFWLYRANEVVVSLGIADPLTLSGNSALHIPHSALRQKESLFLHRFPECGSKHLLLFLGRIHEKKGCDLLLRAFAALAPSHPELQLVMAGPEQPGSSFRTLAAELGLASRVTWTGMLTGDLKWAALHCSDAFVLPSHQENFGMAVVEALACGVPVLISREVNIWREVISAHAGLADSDDLAGTTRLLATWLSLSDGERGAMHAQARECFLRQFEIGTAAGRLLEVVRAAARRSTVPAVVHSKQVIVAGGKP